MPSLFWRTDLGPGPVKVVAGSFTAGSEIAAAEGSRVYFFVPSDGEYSLYSAYDLNERITGLTAVRIGTEVEGTAVTTADRVAVLNSRQGALAVVAESGRETGADFADVAAGDLDGDGLDEIVAAAPGRESIYVYRLVLGDGEAVRLELAGIRAVPGPPRYVAVLKRPDGINVIAVAHGENDQWGLSTYRLTEEGFEEGAALAGQPLGINSMVTGDVLARPGEELALGVGGMVWLVGDGSALEVLLVTDSLGTSVSALATSGESEASLGAGTPEGYVFLFNYPAKRAPDQVFSPVEGVTGLSFPAGGRVAVGTAVGGLQVWSRDIEERTWNYIVKPGDTLWNIAVKVGVPVEQIISENTETIKNPQVIIPGQVIRIPAGNGG
ncbi:MAG: hypothetical protein JL50_04005 [Peptococcaceae bacterium BICA1-7]|nr:MAG: hypothetical protein JL50_04005 [Peptococcaceae bacterium BICA1-7]